MNDIFEKDQNNSLRVINNKKFCYSGPWKQLDKSTVIDSFFINEFSSGEYTISVDLDKSNKEIIKCLIVAGDANASISVYGRSTTESQLIDIAATTNGSEAFLVATPKTDRMIGSRIIFSAQLFKAVND